MLDRNNALFPITSHKLYSEDQQKSVDSAPNGQPYVSKTYLHAIPYTIFVLQLLKFLSAKSFKENQTA